MDVSIIIVNFNTMELISNCIQSIYKKTSEIDYEIIVVDNASADGSQQMITKKFPDVKLIELKENIGFGRANNKGVEVAKGRNILFLNPDTILINNAIKELSEFLDLNLKVGACGGNLYNEEMKPTHSFRRILPSIAYELNELLVYLPEKILFGKNWEHNYKEKSISVGYITGADLMTRNSLILKIGVFLPNYFMYFEETDLCYRIRKAGFKVASVPKAKIQHLEGKSFVNEDLNRMRISFSEESRQTYYKINYSLFYLRIVNLIYFINLSYKTHFLKLRKSKSYIIMKTTLDEFKKIKI